MIKWSTIAGIACLVIISIAVAFKPRATGAPRELTGIRCLSPGRYVLDIDLTGKRDATAGLAATAARSSALGMPMCADPGATYRLSRLWMISESNLRLDLAGATFVMASGTGSPTMIRITGVGDTIEGGTFDGNRARNSGTYAGLIDIFSAGNTVRRAAIQHAPGFGIRIIASDTTIEDNHLTDTVQSAVWSEALTAGGDLKGLTIRRNHIEHLTYTPKSPVDMCIQVHATSSNWSDVYVEDNDCTMIQGSGNSSASNYVPFTVMGTELLGASSSYQVRGYRLRGNHYSFGGQSWSVGNTRDGVIDHNVSYLPSSYGGEIAQSNDSIAASGNVQELGGTAVGNCVWFSAGNTNISYSDGSCHSGAVGQDGFYAFNTQIALSNVNVEMVNAGIGIHCLACTKSTIDGGVISGSPTQAVDVSQPSGVLVRSVNASGFTSAGINFDDGAAKGNYFYAAIGNMLAPAPGATNITENFAAPGDVVTGSALKANVSTTGAVTDVQH